MLRCSSYNHNYHEHNNYNDIIKLHKVICLCYPKTTKYFMKKSRESILCQSIKISITTVIPIVFYIDEVSQLLMLYCQIKDSKPKQTIVKAFIAVFLRMKQNLFLH